MRRIVWADASRGEAREQWAKEESKKSGTRGDAVRRRRGGGARGIGWGGGSRRAADDREGGRGEGRGLLPVEAHVVDPLEEGGHGRVVAGGFEQPVGGGAIPVGGGAGAGVGLTKNEDGGPGKGGRLVIALHEENVEFPSQESGRIGPS